MFGYYADSPWVKRTFFALKLVAILLVELILASFTIILLHEVGHLLAGIAFGWTVESFAIGFGASMVDIPYAGIHWKLNIIPLGGYNQFSQASIATAPYYQKLLVFSAGLAVNALGGFACYRLALRQREKVHLRKVFYYFSMGHLGLLAFNLMPYSYLDGGHMVDATLELFLDRSTIYESNLVYFTRFIVAFFVYSAAMTFYDNVKKRWRES